VVLLLDLRSTPVGSCLFVLLLFLLLFFFFVGLGNLLIDGGCLVLLSHFYWLIFDGYLRILLFLPH
jgi:hypothetical protein